MDCFSFHLTTKWILIIVVVLSALITVIQIPPLFMCLSMYKWDHKLTNELKFLYDEYNQRTEKERIVIKEKKIKKEEKFSDILKIPDVLDEKTKELKTIHDFIYSTLDKIQNEGDCEKKKIVRCSNTLLSGFGSTIHRHVICIHIAFALGRAFFFDQEHFREFNGLAAFTKLESGKCSYLKKNLTTIKDRCDFKDLNCYLNKDGYEIDNKYKLLDFTHEAAFPAPRFIPGTLPKGILKRLKKVGVKKPWHWFTCQLLGYMIMRPNEMFEKKFNEAFKTTKLHRPMVGVHFRGTDKVYMESRQISKETYINKIAHVFNEKLKLNGTRYVYVASDDSRMLKKMRTVLDDLYFIQGTPLGTNQRTIGKRKDNTRGIMQTILMDIYFLIQCDYSVVTFSSNVGRLIWELKTSQFPYSADDKVLSLDYNMFYAWYDYEATLPYYLTVRDNDQAIRSGEDLIMPYKKGQLYFRVGTLKRSIKTFLVDGVATAVQHVRLRHTSSPPLIGYVLQKDLVEWPGAVFYKYDLFLD